MFKKNGFKQFALASLIIALFLAVLPLSSVAAQEGNPPGDPVVRGERLEMVWARQQQAYERMGKVLERGDDLTTKVQGRLDKAKSEGKDVAAVQAALDVFEQALKDAHPAYESIKGIVNSHQGFDANGKVTDVEKARQTVEEMRGKLKAVRSTLRPAGQALREAIRTFREANYPAQASGASQ